MSSSSPRIDYHIQPGGSLKGSITVPGDKSISHRSLMLSAIANGKSRITGFLPGEDTLATMNALQHMGVAIHRIDETTVEVNGVGMHGLQDPAGPLDLGNSGTSTRLFAGLLAGAGVQCELIGDASLMTRPMARVVNPLKEMGANITATATGTLPLKIAKAESLSSIEYDMPVASAQLKSCLLLAGMYAQGKTVLNEPASSRDHTERMLKSFGVEVKTTGHRLEIETVSELIASDILVPADISSATFFMVGAAIARGSDLMLKSVGINPTRDAVIHILQAMGADIELKNIDESGAEPIADIHVKGSQLKGIEIKPEWVPIAIDEFPAVMIAASVAEGTTVLKGAKELRVKESDRIDAVCRGLEAIGVQVEEFKDGMAVTGGEIIGGTVDSKTDHRIAMSFAIAGLCAKEEIIVQDCANVATSFPGFEQLADNTGLMINSISK